MRIIGIGLAEPEVTGPWAETQGYDFELWTDDERVLVEAYRTLSELDPDAPLRHAYVLDESGEAVLFYEGGISLGPAAAVVLEDLQVLLGAEG